MTEIFCQFWILKHTLRWKQLREETIESRIDEKWKIKSETFIEVSVIVKINDFFITKLSNSKKW